MNTKVQDQGVIGLEKLKKTRLTTIAKRVAREQYKCLQCCTQERLAE